MYGPTIPATGGGWFVLPTAGLIYGGIFGNVIILGISLGLIILIIIGLVRLRRGERKITARDKK